jgi:2-desacetyl-2-hydroxyethyl bacteriochlorophyllide A dehydrogenase
MRTARTLYFLAPRRVEIRDSPLPPVGEEQVLVETACSAISAGTETLVYTGQFPCLKSAHDQLSSGMKYPLAYGYSAVGKVVETGRRVDRKWVGRYVFGFQPHTSHFIAAPKALIPIPESISPDAACFLPNMETAVNLVQDGAPILGENVLVLGQGIIGLLTASLLSDFPLASLITADLYEMRRTASMNLKITRSLDPTSEKFAEEATGSPSGKFDLVFELSGSPAVLDLAIEFAAFSGRIVIGSWYGEKRGQLNLGGAFHRSRIKLISSQVSTISPELSGRWDKIRRFDVAWKALARTHPEQWITHRFKPQDADKAYRLLEDQPGEALQVLFDYS